MLFARRVSRVPAYSGLICLILLLVVAVTLFVGRPDETAEAGSVMRNWRLGLYSGLAGKVCLMLDIENPDEAALPGVEG